MDGKWPTMDTILQQGPREGDPPGPNPSHSAGTTPANARLTTPEGLNLGNPHRAAIPGGNDLPEEAGYGRKGLRCREMAGIFVELDVSIHIKRIGPARNVVVHV